MNSDKNYQFPFSQFLKLSDEQLQKCEDCGANLEHRIQNNTQGLFCHQCHKWIVVTTYILEIRQDITKYNIYLYSADFKNKEHIKALAKVANINFLQAKAMAKIDLEF